MLCIPQVPVWGLSEQSLSFELGGELVREVGGAISKQTVVKPARVKFSKQIAAITTFSKPER